MNITVSTNTSIDGDCFIEENTNTVYEPRVKNTNTWECWVYYFNDDLNRLPRSGFETKTEAELNCMIPIKMSQIWNWRHSVDLLDITVAAKMLGVHEQTLRQWDKTGKLKALRTKGGHRRYRLIDIQKERGEK